MLKLIFHRQWFRQLPRRNIDYSFSNPLSGYDMWKSNEPGNGYGDDDDDYNKDDENDKDKEKIIHQEKH